jgi:hypothetical protein
MTKGKEPLFGPHPDDFEAIREGFEAADDEDALSPEESAAYLRWLETGEAPDELRGFFETGKR